MSRVLTGLPMFDSLSGGYFPVVVLAILAAWLLARVRPIWLRVLLAIVVPIGISLAWFVVPRIPDLIKPAEFGEDSWLPWTFMATAAWSALAVPVCLVATVAFSSVRNRRRRRRAS